MSKNKNKDVQKIMARLEEILPHTGDEAVDDAAKIKAKEEFRNMPNLDHDTEHTMVFKPHHIRGKHAAYDPRFKKSKDILAAEGGMIQKMAEGGMAEDMSGQDFDSLPSQQMPPTQTIAQRHAQSPINQQTDLSGQDFDSIQDDSEKYGTAGQMLKTGLEGAAQGVVGPLAPLIETKVLGVNPQDILAREKENPITHGVGEFAGFTGSLLTGVGEAKLMGMAGEAAVHAIPAISEGLAGIKAAEMGVQAAKAAGKGVEEAQAALKAAKAMTPRSFKVGSEAIKQATEMAVLQSGNEVSKMILQDPDTSAESALANIGLASAFGAGTGAFMSGVVSPLWEASGASEKMGNFLKAVKSHADGGTAILPDELKTAQNTLSNVMEHEPVDANKFYDKIQEVINDKNPMFKANITPYRADEYAGFQTFLSPDGKSGYAIKPDGELISVFSQVKGRGESLVDDAVLNKGAQKLDAFDINGKLPNLYSKYMDETSRLKFADEYAPKDWNYEHLGRPDIVMMGLNPEKVAANKANMFPIPPELQAVMSGNETAVNSFNVLKETRNKQVMEALDNLHNNVSNSVASSAGVLPEEVAIRSISDEGNELKAAFQKEYNTKYAPVAEAMERRNAEAVGINVPDEARIKQYGKILEDGMQKVGTDSPLYKNYEHWGNRLLAKDTVGGMDMLKTELSGEIDKAIRAGDTNSLTALKDIRTAIADFQEDQIAKQAYQIGEKSGLRSAEEIINSRAEANRGYREFANLSHELMDHLGVGRFSGAKGLMNKLSSMSPEQLAHKFSFKGNAEFIPFLQQHFPEVFDKVKENELKKFLKPSVLMAKGEQPINISKLNDAIKKGMAEDRHYIEAILPKAFRDKVEAANTLLSSIPNLKSSGTAGHMSKVFAQVPAAAMSMLAMLTGHNPLIGGILGHAGQLLGRDAPDAIRLAHLKFLASDAPIKAEGFKAMVDYMHSTIKGENMLAKATKSVFKAGAQVLPENLMPAKADRDKLDKIVTKIQNNPSEMMKAQNGQVGHYFPDHQAALSQSSTRAIQYLQGIKPQPHILGPLDKPVPPQPYEIARYNRALDIAQQPAIVLHHIKEGTLQQTDLDDLKGMYPALYKQMATKMTNEMTAKHSDDIQIPYKTRMGISFFLGQPIDSSMTPSSIMAAQPKPQAAPQQGQNQGNTRKGTTSLGKSNKSFMTPNQASEADKANKD